MDPTPGARLHPADGRICLDFFALLISGIGLLVVIYSRILHLARGLRFRRFYLFFLAFTGSMLGVVLSGNLILLVVFWELTSVFSLPADRLLASQPGAARDGARMASTITAIGGLGTAGRRPHRRPHRRQLRSRRQCSASGDAIRSASVSTCRRSC